MTPIHLANWCSEIANFTGIHLIVGQPGINLVQIVILGERYRHSFLPGPSEGDFVMFVMIEAVGGCFDFFD